MAIDSKAVCVVLGGGGHALVVIDAIQTSGIAEVLGVLDADPSRWGHELLGAPVIGDDEVLGELKIRGATCFAVGVGSVGDSRIRERLFDLGRRKGLTPLIVMHPSATCARSARVGPGCQLLAGSVVNPGVTLGANVLVNTGAIVEHDCVIDDHAHIASGATLASGIRVGRGAHIGAGATLRQLVTIGDRAVIGAGAVVVRDVADGVVVVGNPARTLRRVRDEAAAAGGHSGNRT